MNYEFDEEDKGYLKALNYLMRLDGVTVERVEKGEQVRGHAQTGETPMKKVFKMIKAIKGWFIIKGKKEGAEISIEEAHKLLQKKEPIVLLDIRKREEITLEYIGGATFIPQDFLEEQVEILLPDKNITVIVYCADGIGSLEASKMLREKSYSHVFSMAKGINGWKAAGYEVIRGFPMPLYLRTGQVAKRVPKQLG